MIIDDVFKLKIIIKMKRIIKTRFFRMSSKWRWDAPLEEKDPFLHDLSLKEV